MKLTTIAASLALLLGGQAIAGYAPVDHKMERLQAKLDRNQNAYYAQADWFKRICVSGLVQVYAGYADRDGLGYASAGEGFGNLLSFIGGLPNGSGVRFANNAQSGSDLWLSRANVYIDADVNEYVETHIAFDFSNILFGNHVASFDDERFWVLGSLGNKALLIPDEAYITIGNFAKSPVYFRAGREYLRLGHYERNVVPGTMVQYMTQTQADVLELGAVDVSGFNGAVYVFRSIPRFGEMKAEINNWGAQIGYVWHNGPMGLDLTADWMNDAAAVNMTRLFLGAPSKSSSEGIWHVSAMGHYEQFDAMLQFATTAGSYNTSVMTYNGTGAQPQTWIAGLGYTLSLMHNNDAHIGVNYQQSKEALAFNLPKNRFQCDFRWEVWKNTEVGVYLYHDKDYGTGNNGTALGLGTNEGNTPSININGTGNSNFTALASLTARFS